jgi:uncharacterized membrane protein
MRKKGSMNLVPDWAPNIHPLLVHFPIALLLTAAGLDVVGWVLRRNRSLRQAATLLYVVGTGASVAAYVTGRAASQTLWFPGMAQAVVREHWDWAFRTVWFFSMATVVRLVLLRPSRREPSPVIIAALALAGLVGIGLLLETGDRGGRLVYQHGVGTARQ